MDRRLGFALTCYLMLAILGYLTLDWQFRTALWVLLGGLALKSWIASVSKRDT